MLRLITGSPRSGTTYMADVVQEAGLFMSHEASGATMDGVVSFAHCGQPELWDVILHQVRHPLKVIASSKTNSPGVYGVVATILHKKCNKLFPGYQDKGAYQKNVLDGHLWPMWSWCYLNKYIDQIAHYRYKIEEIEAAWPVICEYLAIPKIELPKIPKNINTRPHEKLSWEDLDKTDLSLSGQIKKMAVDYGYKL